MSMLAFLLHSKWFERRGISLSLSLSLSVSFCLCLYLCLCLCLSLSHAHIPQYNKCLLKRKHRIEMGLMHWEEVSALGPRSFSGISPWVEVGGWNRGWDGGEELKHSSWELEKTRFFPFYIWFLSIIIILEGNLWNLKVLISFFSLMQHRKYLNVFLALLWKRTWLGNASWAPWRNLFWSRIA